MRGGVRTHDHQQILHLFDQGLSAKEVAAALPTKPSASLVTTVLKAHGRSPRARRYPQTAEVDKTTLVRDYQAGQSLEAVARTHGVSPQTVHRALQAAGIACRPYRPRGKHGPENYQYIDGRSRKKRPQWAILLTYQVAAICLGHLVPEGWQVHHMNEDWSDNRPENLAVFPSKSSHALYHQRLLRLRREGRAVDTSRLLQETGGRALPLPSGPIQFPHDRDRLSPS